MLHPHPIAEGSAFAKAKLGLRQVRNTGMLDFAQEQQAFMSKHKVHNRNTARIGLESFCTFSEKQGMETCLLQGRMEFRR